MKILHTNSCMGNENKRLELLWGRLSTLLHQIDTRKKSNRKMTGFDPCLKSSHFCNAYSHSAHEFCSIFDHFFNSHNDVKTVQFILVLLSFFSFVDRVMWCFFAISNVLWICFVFCLL